MKFYSICKIIQAGQLRHENRNFILHDNLYRFAKNNIVQKPRDL